MVRMIIAVLALLGVAQLVIARTRDPVAPSARDAPRVDRTESATAHIAITEPDVWRDSASVEARTHAHLDIAARVVSGPYYQLVRAGRALAITADDRATLVPPADEPRQHWKLVAVDATHHRLTSRIRGERMALEVSGDRPRLVGTTGDATQTWRIDHDPTGARLTLAASPERALAIEADVPRAIASDQRWQLIRVRP